MEAPNFLNLALGLIQLLGGAWCVHLYNQQSKFSDTTDQLGRELADHKLRTAETYMTKSESTRAFDGLNRTLDTLVATVTARFDKIDEKLDRKADKP